MTTGIATDAAAELPPIEETEEVWAEDEPTESLPAETNATTEAPEAAVASEAQPAEAPAEQETPEPAQMREKAKAFDDLSAAFARDAIGYMRSMHALLTPEQRAALGVREAQHEAAVDLNEVGWADENLTAPERFVKANLGYIHDLPRFAQGVTHVVGTHEQALIHHDNSLAALAAQVHALSEVLGMAMPQPKLKGLDPKAREAYAAEVKATAAKTRAQRQSVETVVPRTPRNGAAGSADTDHDLTPRANESFTQLFRRVAAAARS